ncbi:MAG: tryptophanase [Candidatus Zixiibacteriota bacterium]|nr:MAG: tryptophanase [candidate division Zixibacteria bacterium]
MTEFPVEPYRIKSIERIRKVSRSDRERLIKEARFNIFKIRAEDIYIDFLTDSGTSAMSDSQWAGLLTGDESYAGCRNYFHFEETARSITGFKYIIPVHQGRAAEHMMFSTLIKPGDKIPSNNHFDTTRANIEYCGAEAADLVIAEGKSPSVDHPFKGNIDTDILEDFIKVNGPENIPFGMLTITNNSGGGQPVSLENIKKTSEILRGHGIPFILDACRYAENCYFIKQREKGQSNRSVKDIAREVFSYADGCTMSAKKDGLANIGGFIGTNDNGLHEKVTNAMILVEGFRTYGGLAGRDLEAVARGLEEALDEDYLAHRVNQIKSFGDLLIDAGIPIVTPTGGHAVFVDATALLPEFPREHYPGWALSVALYREGGIRGCEIGGIVFGKKGKDGREVYPPLELVRLAVPRRVYTESHFRYAASTFKKIAENKSVVRGLKIAYEPKYLRHFTVEFDEL